MTRWPPATFPPNRSPPTRRFPCRMPPSRMPGLISAMTDGPSKRPAVPMISLLRCLPQDAYAFRLVTGKPPQNGTRRRRLIALFAPHFPTIRSTAFYSQIRLFARAKRKRLLNCLVMRELGVILKCSSLSPTLLPRWEIWSDPPPLLRRQPLRLVHADNCYCWREHYEPMVWLSRVWPAMTKPSQSPRKRGRFMNAPATDSASPARWRCREIYCPIEAICRAPSRNINSN